MGDPRPGRAINVNPNHDAADTYALIIEGAVQNLIVISYNNLVAGAYLDDFDFAVDVTVGGQQFADVGSSYDAATNTFAEPPIDYQSNIIALMASIDSNLKQLLYNASSVGPLTLANAFSISNAEQVSGYTFNEASIMSAIAAYVAAGG